MKCFIFFNLIILVSISVSCPSSEWFRFKNKCYLTNESKTYLFRDSVVFCESQHATTVSILSAEENNFIQSKLSIHRGYWLGIRQVDFNKETYEWLDGSPYNYSNWTGRIQNNCSGAYIFNGEWADDTQSCDRHGGAFCQIEIYSTIFKMLSETMQETGNLNKEIKEVETRLKSTDDTFKDALNLQKNLLTNMSLEFHADLENTEHRVNKFLVRLRQDVSNVYNQTKFENEIQNLANNEQEKRLSKWNEKLEDKMNRSMALMISDFELDLKNKDTQVDNINKEFVGLRLVNKRLDDALNTQNALIAYMSSDLRQKEIQIKSTNKELVRQSLMITRLENAIHTQNELIERTRSSSDSKSSKN